MTRFLVHDSFKGSDAFVSNVGGPRTPLCMNGSEIKEVYVFETNFSSLTLNTLLISYAGKMRLSMTIDDICGVKAKDIMEIFNEQAKACIKEII